MNYNGTIYRPPIEANTFLLPVTEGCTHNCCTFCNMYDGIPFRMWNLDRIEEYMKEIVREYWNYLERQERIFLVGGDPFALSADKLDALMNLIRKYAPNVEVVTTYASIGNIKAKSDEELEHLRRIGYNELYIGIECGLDDTLEYLNKGFTRDEAAEQCHRLTKAGFRQRHLLMPGAAGKGSGVENAIATAQFENETVPEVILLTTMSAFTGTDLRKDVDAGKFTMAGEIEVLTEEKTFIEHLEIQDTYLWAAHVLDSTPVMGYIGRDKEKMMAQLQYSIDNMDEEEFSKIFQRDHL